MSAIDKMPVAQKEELDRALASMADGEYGATAVKFELEAQLNRPANGDDERYCGDCDGNGYTYCTDGCEDGYFPCPDQCTDGYTDEDQENECEACDGQGEIVCESCDGQDREDCATCDGTGSVPNSERNWTTDGDTDGDEYGTCSEFIFNHVPPEAKDALVFSRFYNDGSVDSEFTFTLMLEHAHMAVYFVEAFKAMADEIGNGLDTSGAGMHIAVLNSADGNYPHGNELDEECADNFVEAMTPLLPAMFFLASATRESRGLRYRPPKIDTSDKYVAISGYHDCFEYRVFETCYKKPLALIDFLIVIAKTLEFYKQEPTDTRLRLGTLGFKDGEGVDRFYYTLEHVKALQEGLKWLKPDYKSIKKLGEERGFNISIDSLKAIEATRAEKWRKEFDQVKARRSNERKRLKHEALATAYRMINEGQSVDPEKYAKERVDKSVNDPTKNLKGDVRTYIASQQAAFMRRGVAYSVAT